MTNLCDVWWCSKMIFLAIAFPKLKKMLFLKDILYLKRRSCLHSHPLAQSHTKQILQCNNQASELQLPHCWNHWNHWAKWQLLGVWMPSLTHVLRSSNWNFNSSFGNRELLETKQTKSTAKQDFSGEALSKWNILTSLAFMRLVPGAIFIFSVGSWVVLMSAQDDPLQIYWIVTEHGTVCRSKMITMMMMTIKQYLHWDFTNVLL